MSGMRLSKIGYDDGKTRHYTFEPLGYGCSQDCMAPRKCWAARQAVRQRRNCPDCADFKVHFHPERLEQPAKTKKPGVVLVGFHADLFDEQRAPLDITNTLLTAAENPQHNYVFLTKNAVRMQEELDGVPLLSLLCGAPNWYLGLAIRTQAEADEKLRLFLSIPGNLWLSLEPIWGPIELWSPIWWSVTRKRLSGIIVGHDNKYGAPGTDSLDHIRSIVSECKAGGVPVYVKQLHTAGGTRFLRASHPGEFALYPEDLKLRNLPWTMPEASQ